MGSGAFHNYVTGEWTEGALSDRRDDSGRHVGPGAGPQLCADCARGLGRAEVAVRRRQPRAQRAGHASYHLWAVAPAAAAVGEDEYGDTSLFDNRKVNIDTSIAGLARLAGDAPPAWLTDGLRKIQPASMHSRPIAAIRAASMARTSSCPSIARPSISTLASRRAILSAKAKSDLAFELGAKIDQFQTHSKICSAST